MSRISDVEIADRLSKRRARASAALAIAFIATQGGSLSSPSEGGPFDLPFLLWAAMLLIILMFGGGWFRSGNVREAMNDETTRAHRSSAMAGGFLVALAGAFLLYAVTFFEEVTAREAVRLIITMGVAGALLRFATLEGRALDQ